MSSENWGRGTIYLIKNRRYCTNLVPGDAIDDHLSTKDLGDTDVLKGNLDNHNYEIICLKYPDYVMKIMPNYSGLREYPSQKVYTCPFTNTTGEAKTVQLK